MSSSNIFKNLSSHNIFNNKLFKGLTSKLKDLLNEQEKLLKNQIIFKDNKLLNNIDDYDEESLKKQEMLNKNSLFLLTRQEEKYADILSLLENKYLSSIQI